MRNRVRVVGVAIFMGAILFVAGHTVGQAQKAAQPTEKYLIISEYDLTVGKSVNEATTDASLFIVSCPALCIGVVRPTVLN